MYRKPFFYIYDPLYGFIDIREPIFRYVVAHPFFQRLRHISQTGLASFVYPSATHTRFSHSLGTYYLMGTTISELRKKGVDISRNEEIALRLTALLHDIGHAPFSHVLEFVLTPYSHEEITLHIAARLQESIGEDLSQVLLILKGKHPRPFFNALISSQIDMDRLDYLNRDSFFTGVAEGTIGYSRIIKTLTSKEERLAVEEKALLSIENFLHARMVMYRQVYLHKTVLAIEMMVIKAIERAAMLMRAGESLQCPIPLRHIIENPSQMEDIFEVDDHTIWHALRTWTHAKDTILAFLARSILSRKVFKAQTGPSLLSEEERTKLEKKLLRNGFSREAFPFLIIEKEFSIGFYDQSNPILILRKDDTLVPFHEMSPITANYPPAEKFFGIFYPLHSPSEVM